MIEMCNELKDIAGQHQPLAGCCPAAGSSICGREDSFPALQSSSTYHLQESKSTVANGQVKTKQTPPPPIHF